MIAGPVPFPKIASPALRLHDRQYRSQKWYSALLSWAESAIKRSGLPRLPCSAEFVIKAHGQPFTDPPASGRRLG